MHDTLPRIGYTLSQRESGGRYECGSMNVTHVSYKTTAGNGERGCYSPVHCMYHQSAHAPCVCDMPTLTCKFFLEVDALVFSRERLDANGGGRVSTAVRELHGNE